MSIEKYQKFAGDYYQRAFDSEVAIQRRWVRQRVNKVIEEVVNRLDKSDRILDLGCGSGVFIKQLKLRGYCNVFGLDINLQHIIFSSKYTGSKKFVMADAVKIPFRDNMFDCVICAEVVEHLGSPRAALAEIAGVLKPCGLLFLTTPNSKSLFPLIWSLWKGWKGKIWRGEELHLSSFTPKSLNRLLKNCGFKLVKTETFLSNPLLLLLGKTGLKIDSIFDKLGLGSLILAIART
jgi:2-polyprenyl-3-methyl-5-hydroxy-6-metoxy-1,4-benzoquinol methylase